MTSESEVSCGVIKWLSEELKNKKMENNDLIMGFWIDTKTNNAICSEFEIRGNNIKKFLIDEFGLDKKSLEGSFLGVNDFKITLEDNNLIPDIVAHFYYVSEAYSETWVIECKGDSTSSIQRASAQVMGHAKAFAKSYIALPIEKSTQVSELAMLGYGVLKYDSSDKTIEFTGKVKTQADPKLFNYFNKYLRDLHFKSGILPYFREQPFIQRRIALSTNLALGQASEGLQSSSSHLADLKNVELIDENFGVPDRAKSFFSIIDGTLRGKTDMKRINYFRNKFPSIQTGILYKQSEYGYFMVNLLKIYLTANRSIQEFIGWIAQASLEANTKNPVMAHICTIGLKQNPLLATDLFFKKSTRAPIFQLNLARSTPNMCAVCNYKDKAEFCFCTDSDVGFYIESFNDDTSKDKYRRPFQEMYNEFFEVWNNNLPIDFFIKEELKNKYLKTFEYKNGNKTEIIAPGLIKCLLNTNWGKTMGLLRHAGIVREEVYSGLKAEFCPRYEEISLFSFDKDLKTMIESRELYIE